MVPTTLHETAPPAFVDATAKLASFIASSAVRQLPESVRHATSRAFANWLGCALGGERDEATRAVLAVALHIGGRGNASIVGRAEQLDAVNAALVNGFAANALDYDDMHVPTLIHPTPAVVAAALAMGEERRAPGTRVLNAIAAGIEVECRLGLALFPGHYDAGWHSTATLGTLGAVAAASAVAGLDEELTAHALGIAATQSGGLRAMLPNPCKSFNTGRAASAGVLAALLAEAGLRSEPSVLEAKHGLFSVFGEPRDRAALVCGLGERYLVGEVSLKPYPCGVVIHPLIDACLDIVRAHDIDARRIRAVQAAVHARAIELAGHRHPENGLTGRFSLYHAAALALARRSASLRAFEDADVSDPQLVRLRGLMAIVPDGRLKPGEARARVELVDGTILERAVDHPSGSPECPLSDARLKEKFMELAEPTTGARRGEALFDACLGLERIADIRELRRRWVTE